ncbi:MFS transporter [Streptomyces phyllanthi]
MTAVSSVARPTVDRATRNKIVLASSVGTTIEMYDFFIYGTAAALVFSGQFFPQVSPVIGTLLAFATFGVGFVARPLGGVVIGHYGDRIGRKKTLVFTLIMMGLATFCIGLLPTYDSVGLAAPALLVTLRLIQGFCAGGEWGGAVLIATENAPENRRGLYGSWTMMGSPAGLVLATGAFALVTALPTEQFESWGWRLPFLASGVLLALGLFLRVSLTETPEFLEMSKSRTRERSPLMKVLRSNPRSVLLGAGVNLGFNTFIYLVFTFSLAYSIEELGLAKSVIMTGTIVGALLQIGAIPAFAVLSDRVGRHVVLLGGAAFTIIWTAVFFAVLNTAQPAMIIIATVLAFVGSAAMIGPMGAGLTELFGTSVRYTGASLGYQLGAVLGGGLAPFIAASLFAGTGTTWTIVAYGASAGAISALSVGLLWRDTRRAAAGDEPAPALAPARVE